MVHAETEVDARAGIGQVRQGGEKEVKWRVPMRNLEIAFIFNQIADLLEIHGANPFRVLAYRRAAINIECLADNIETIALNGTLRNISGIGEDLANKIDEYIRTGRMEFHEQLKNEVPLGLAKMVEIPS